MNFELEEYIGCLAIYTGISTINGQRWLSRIDYIDGVDLRLQDPYLVTRLALRIAPFTGRERWIKLLSAANAMFRLLCHELADMCGTRITTPAHSTQEVANQCIEAIKESPGTTALVTALSNVHSVTITSNIHKVLSATIEWAFQHVPDFEEWWPEFGALKKTDDSVFMNELEVILEATEEFRGVIFGHEFICEYEKVLWMDDTTWLQSMLTKMSKS
ncbi:UNVERIFIED_CONTAM: hypothetical protein HDU68_005849 [Siphonaria sp. JEL0065]|nr:hypothetical protein HDU68_005849 [Siphonaria sp. JEL0065]